MNATVRQYVYEQCYYCAAIRPSSHNTEADMFKGADIKMISRFNSIM